MLLRIILLLPLISLFFDAISQCTYTFPVSASYVCSDNGSGLPDHGSPTPVINNRVFVSASSAILCEAASLGLSAEMEPNPCTPLNDIWITEDGIIWYYHSTTKFDIHPTSNVAWFNSGNSTSGATVIMNTVGSGSSSPTLCINTALTDITHSTTGATGIGSATGLPSGVSASWSSDVITITGTPSASGTFNYTIPLTGGCGSVNATGTITVTADNTVGSGSSSPTLCINTALTDITHSTTGATGIGSATGLPPGVNASWSSNEITISGTPSASGTFNYTIPLTGGCGSVNATGTIKGTANNTVGSASSTPTLCINTALTDITHATTGATGIGSATGLPSGVSASWSSDVITITGTPSASGTFNYTIPLTGGCGSVNATGTITVTADNTAGVASSTPTLCINTALTDITHATTGATGIGSVTGLPSGVSASWSSDEITISGTPSASGTFNYTIRLTGGCGSVNATGTITVTADNTVGSASSTPTLCINTALTNITHATTVATGIGSATGLPSGVSASWSSDEITITGTPSASGTFNYTIPLTGGCGSVNTTGTITVTADNTVGSASSTPTLCINTALTDITHATTGATGIGSATGLPSGVSASWSSDEITITGTPSASGTFNYTIPLTGGCGSVNATGTITVTADNTAGVASSTPTLCINTALTDITHATTGATGIGSVTGLPSGVSASWSSDEITISGTPSASGTFNYTIPLTGGCGSVNATGTITVTADNTVGSASSTPTLCINTALTNITHATTVATGIGSATGLPSGVSASWSSDEITISGTPSASGTFNYTIPLTGGCGSVNTTGTITVTADNTVGSASSTPTLCINTALTDITHATTGATGIGSATGLPSGVSASWSSDEITITGTPSASGTFNYTIPLTGGCGSVNATGTITVTADNTAGVASSTPTLCINTALTDITHATTGATGIGSVTGLPSGVSASWSSDEITISGTPSASGTFNYTIPLTGGCGSVNATGTITVTADNTVGSASSTPTLCINTALTNITHATTVATGIGSATGLPSGVSASWSSDEITITGTPSASGTFNYTIPLTGGCGSVNTTGTITVTADNTVGSASSTPTLCINTALTDITHATTGATGIGSATGLPSGVSASWSSDEITITGTPSASGTFNYAIPLTGGCGSVNATGTITVGALADAGSLSGSSNTLGTGQTVQLSSSGSSGGTWSSDNTGVATVNSSGLVTAAGVGSTNINYTITGTDGCSDDIATYSISVLGSISSGNWSDPLIWSGGAKPTAGQNITIAHDVTVDESTADLGNTTINSGSTLTVGAFTFEVSGTLDNNGTISIANSSSVVDVDGEYDATGGNTTFSAAGRLQLGGTTTSLGTFTESTGTVEYDGSTQNVLAENYYNLVIDQPGNKTAQGVINVANDMTISNSASLLTSTNTIDVSGATTVGATLEIGNALYNSRGGFSATGNINFSHGGGKLRFYTVSPTSLGILDNSLGTVVYMSGATNVLSDDYYTLTIDDGGTAKTLQGDANIAGNLNIKSGNQLNLGTNKMTTTGTSDIDGTLNISTGTYDANGAFDATGGSVTFTDAGRLELAGTVTSLGTFTPSTGKVIYNGGVQNVLAETYNNLTIRFAGTKTAIGNVNVNNIFVIRTNATYDIASTTTTVTGTSYVNTTATLSLSTGTFDANGEFDATGGTVSTAGAGSLELGSTVTSLGTFGGTQSTLLFNGSSAQTINATSVNAGNLIVNNASGVTLNADVTVNATLTLTSGDITSTSANKLSLKSSVSGGSSSSHISGPVDFIADATNECTIPVGNGTDYTPIKLQRNGGSATTYTAEYTSGTAAGASLNWNSYPLGLPHSGSNISSVNHAYYVDIAQASGSADAHVSLYFGDFNTVPSATDQYVVHWDGSKWEELTTVSRSGNYVKVLATSFSPFGQGSGGAALPIDLVSFTGECVNNKTEIEFVVASQVNNDYYTIERSVDGNEWSEVGIIDGEGNTSTQMTYKWIDISPTNGVNYYRLSQTDFDGTSETFAPIAVTCENEPVDGYSVYPNPVNGAVKIDIELDHYQGDDVSIELIDINGKIIQSQPVQLNRGFNNLEINLNQIPSGVYMINFVGTKEYIKESMVVKQ